MHNLILRFIPKASRELTVEEVEANARLVAAAPELLEALKLAEEMLRDQAERFHTDCRCVLCESALPKAQAAIAKAEAL